MTDTRKKNEIYMKVVTNANIVSWDIDNTLLMDTPGEGQKESDAIVLDYYGMPRKRWPHRRHIELLKSHKERGFYNRLHSANGHTWALEAARKLELTTYIDAIETKCRVFVDDKPVVDWSDCFCLPDIGNIN